MFPLVISERSIHLNTFKTDVGAVQLVLTTFTATTGLGEVLDNHVPLGHRRITDGPSAPWLTLQTKEAKQKRRRAKRRRRKSGLTVHRQIFIHHREKVKKLSCRQTTTMCPSTSRADLFHITDHLSGKRKNSTFPSSIPTVDLSDTFGDFFSAKIQSLRDEHDATSGQPDFTKQKELKQS